MTAPLLVRLGAHDRALMLRCAIAPSASPGARALWTGVTHLGGTRFTLLAAALPWFACCALHQASRLALTLLVVSHLAVQIIKRYVVRCRPAGACGRSALVREPDPFSFPSGHATASMAVALGYGAVFPGWAVLLLLLALAVGVSRVRLGVHYPSDVLVGQLIAAVTAAGVLTIR